MQQDKDLKFTQKGKLTKLNPRIILKKNLVKKKLNLDKPRKKNKTERPGPKGITSKQNFKG